MYGSSLRMETRRPRALRIRPTLAAVMPLPSEEVTPPVTKTYFAMGLVLRGFFQCYRNGPRTSNRRGLRERPHACESREPERRSGPRFSGGCALAAVAGAVGAATPSHAQHSFPGHRLV